METFKSPEIIHKTINDYSVLEYCYTNVFIIENILDDELCQEFIQLIETVPKSTSDWKPGNNVKCFYNPLYELLKRDDTDYYPIYTEENEIQEAMEKMKKNEKITTNRLNGFKNKQVKNLDEKLNEKFKILDNILKELLKKDIFSFNHHCGINLRKIYGETREHQDGESPIIEGHNSLQYIKEHNLHQYREKEKGKKKRDKVNIRVLTAVFALNSDYDGGEFCFPNYNIKTKLKKGSVILFPPFWTHNHKVEAPINDTFRYTLNTWIYKNEYTHSYG